MKQAFALFAFFIPFFFSTAHAEMIYPNAITPADAQTMVLAGQAILVDVREQSEVALGMAAPAVWFPKSKIDANLQEFVDFLVQYPGKQVILYCRSGHRASIVIEKLQSAGINALNMGGFQSWVDAGFETKKP